MILPSHKAMAYLQRQWFSGKYRYAISSSSKVLLTNREPDLSPNSEISETKAKMLGWLLNKEDCSTQIDIELFLGPNPSKWEVELAAALDVYAYGIEHGWSRQEAGKHFFYIYQREPDYLKGAIWSRFQYYAYSIQPTTLRQLGATDKPPLY